MATSHIAGPVPKSKRPFTGSPSPSSSSPTVHLENANTLRLKAVVSDVDPEALIRLLQVFQDRNVNPRKLMTQRILLRTQEREVLHVEVEFASADIAMHTLRLIAAKIAQMPMSLSTVFGQEPDVQGTVVPEKAATSMSPRPDNA